MRKSAKGEWSFMERDFIALDIETTGLSPVKDKIIEIGAVKVKNGEIVETFKKLIDPQIKLTERIVNLTGITDNMLEGKEQIETVIHQFLKFAEELPLLGHNILFDYSFLKTAATKEKHSFERRGIDTLYISRVVHEELESKSLGSMCAYYNIVNENHHRAYDDAVASMKLYFQLAKRENATSEVLCAKPLNYKPKKIEPVTQKQKNYLLDLLKYHKIDIRQSMDTMTKSEASRLIDSILFQYGRKQQ